MSSKSSPEVRGREKGGNKHMQTSGTWAWSRGLVSSCSLFCAWILYSCFEAIYNLNYMSLTTRTRLTPKEGAAACSLPCGVGGVRRGVRHVSNDGKWPVLRPARMHALQHGWRRYNDGEKSGGGNGRGHVGWCFERCNVAKDDVA